MASNKEIILYHYSFSPFAKRVVWYMNLRGIPYTQCLQPPTMPRPDIAAIGTRYRRIPIMSIGRDIYNDTRLVLRKLEALYPNYPQICATSPDQKALEELLSSWTIDGGVFQRASALIPSDMPLLRDSKFVKDRESYSGRSWSKENIERLRPEVLVDIKSMFKLLESTLLADGREWVLKTEKPSMADIEAVWPFHWLKGLKGALPPDQVSAKHFPKVFAWIDRFNQAVTAAKDALGKPKTISGADAVNHIGASQYVENECSVDHNDPSGLMKRKEVEVWPIDTGLHGKDRGLLIGLTSEEIVIESRTKGGETVRIHTPRHGFRIRAVGEARDSKL